MTRVSLVAAFLATGFLATGFASAASACDDCRKNKPASQPAAPTNGIGAFDVSAPITQLLTYDRSQFQDPATCIDGRCEGHSHHSHGHGMGECDGHCGDTAGCADEGCSHSHAAPLMSRYHPNYPDQYRRPTATGRSRPSHFNIPDGRRFHGSTPSEIAPPPSFDRNRVPSPFYGTATVASICPIDGQSIETAESPVRISFSGRSIWLCCEACAAELRREPTRYLGRSHVSFTPQPATLADAAAILNQEVCPVTGQQLDPSGEVWKVWVSDRPVFVCCRDCVRQLTDMARREHGAVPR